MFISFFNITSIIRIKYTLNKKSIISSFSQFLNSAMIKLIFLVAGRYSIQTMSYHPNWCLCQHLQIFFIQLFSTSSFCAPTRVSTTSIVISDSIRLAVSDLRTRWKFSKISVFTEYGTISGNAPDSIFIVSTAAKNNGPSSGSSACHIKAMT